jgi:hypothetical protein
LVHPEGASFRMQRLAPSLLAPADPPAERSS